eukprot:scaffold1556_cov278-Prasinococcus_capsulatus_cf.AAC.4
MKARVIVAARGGARGGALLVKTTPRGTCRAAPTSLAARRSWARCRGGSAAVVMATAGAQLRLQDAHAQAAARAVERSLRHGRPRAARALQPQEVGRGVGDGEDECGASAPAARAAAAAAPSHAVQRGHNVLPLAALPSARDGNGAANERQRPG